MVKLLEWTPDLVHAFWAGVSETKSLRDLNFSRLNADQLLDLIGMHIPRRARLLDYGAGDGDLLRPLIEKGYLTAAYDTSPGRLLAQTAATLRNNDNFLGLVDASCDEKFDCVLLIEVVEHLLEEQIDDTFVNIRRLLKSGGTLFVTTPNSEDLGVGVAYCPNCDSLFHRWQHLRSFTPEGLTALLDTHGFDQLNLHHVDFSANCAVIEAKKQLERQAIGNRLRQLVSRLLLRHPREETPGDLRRGAETNLVFIGRKRT